MLLDIIVHLGSGQLPLIHVVEAFGVRETVGLSRLAAVVEQKLPTARAGSGRTAALAALRNCLRLVNLVVYDLVACDASSPQHSGYVGQIVNLRRIVNPPARCAASRFALCIRGVSNCGRRIANPPQVNNLPHSLSTTTKDTPTHPRPDRIRISNRRNSCLLAGGFSIRLLRAAHQDFSAAASGSARLGNEQGRSFSHALGRVAPYSEALRRSHRTGRRFGPPASSSAGGTLPSTPKVS